MDKFPSAVPILFLHATFSTASEKPDIFFLLAEDLAFKAAHDPRQAPKEYADIDHSVRVPTVVAGPAVLEGKTVSEPIHCQDISQPHQPSPTRKFRPPSASKT